RWEWLATRAEQVRALDFTADLPITTLSREQFKAREADDADAIEEGELAEYAETYGRLGFFDLDADLRAILVDSSSWVGATYSPDTKDIVLIGDVPDSTVVHELVHGLQDQHFDLSEYDADDTTDEFLAHRAVVE
ncbi:hypothetical protein VWU05_22305, partial [Xanthomonas citri pv. citri]